LGTSQKDGIVRSPAARRFGQRCQGGHRPTLRDSLSNARSTRCNVDASAGARPIQGLIEFLGYQSSAVDDAQESIPGRALSNRPLCFWCREYLGGLFGRCHRNTARFQLVSVLAPYGVSAQTGRELQPSYPRWICRTFLRSALHVPRLEFD
jgi:hypothetical protein